jgi:hypothetical protein
MWRRNQNFRVTGSTAAAAEPSGQLAIQYSVFGSGNIPVDDCWQHQSIGQRSKRRSHVDGSSCYDQLVTVGLTGSLAGSNVTLASTAVDGQIATFTGRVTDTTFTGT